MTETTSTSDWAAAKPDDRLPSVFRFLTEIAAWLAFPWALADTSVPLAVVAGIVLLAIPTVFSTPGDKRHTIVAVPGRITVAIVILHILAAIYGAWSAWTPWLAVPVTVVALASVVTEQPRWRWLWRSPR